MMLTQPPVCTDCIDLYNRVYSVVSISKKVCLLMFVCKIQLCMHVHAHTPMQWWTSLAVRLGKNDEYLSHCQHNISTGTHAYFMGKDIMDHSGYRYCSGSSKYNPYLYPCRHVHKGINICKVTHIHAIV